MQQPLRQGKIPGRPNLYQGTTPGASGRGFTGSFGLPTKVVRQTLGWQTNHTVNYTYVTRRLKSNGRGSDGSVNIGQFVFIRKFNHPLGDKRLHTLMNVVQLNDMLYRMAAMGREPEKYNAMDAGVKLLDEWAPLGVVTTEIGYDVKNDNPLQEQPQDRLLNCTVMGRCSTFNAFGKAAIIDGCRLYMVLHRVPLDTVRNKYRSNRQVQLQLNAIVPTNEPAGVPDTLPANQYCWQWAPWGNWQTGYPTAEDFVGKSHAVYVGRVSSKGFTAQYGSNQHTQQATLNVNRLVTLPLFEIFVDYDSTCHQ